ncbi:sigma-70 family RNA polymerase sigma factor [Fictibacillus nanhaiensis]|uniref:sigma-70 family RNA polymerase sigma factor n=1 Tax=Fictibacillus nanhaiensis TaxID=742169 RepID=UPI001C967898|nr:sigma-70 family RNA polymerase sigma factor [Fictibacillus nanhaiensis]MBY6037213.1 sigma-70 family RNA polymerase sigma factor [Fictibacillus nanhaiensis]
MEKENSTAEFDLQTLSREEVLIRLMKQYGEEIKRLVFSFIKNWPQTEDVTQDVFITLYTKLDTFRGDSAIRSWIYSIAINKSKDYLKSWNYRKMLLTDKLKGESSSEKDALEFHVISSSEDQLLYQAVLHLPLKYREVILLHYYKEFSVRETSEFLSLKEATVKTRLSRARKLLHDRYIELGGER